MCFARCEDDGRGSAGNDISDGATKRPDVSSVLRNRLEYTSGLIDAVGGGDGFVGAFKSSNSVGQLKLVKWLLEPIELYAVFGADRDQRFGPRCPEFFEHDQMCEPEMGVPVVSPTARAEDDAGGALPGDMHRLESNGCRVIGGELQINIVGWKSAHAYMPV